MKSFLSIERTKNSSEPMTMSCERSAMSSESGKAGVGGKSPVSGLIAKGASLLGSFVERTKVVALVSVMVLLATVAFGQTRPTVGGAVFGGGRMADVEGSTLVTVVNCDTLGAVYGGNDIAGKVQCGTENDSSNAASQVVIGTAATTSTIAIGSVYGGGNGYYSYPTVGTTVTTDALGAGDIQDYDATATVESVEAGLYVPQTLRTKVSVNSNYAQIDSLFGGAKNAFILATTGNSTDLAFRGGTIYAAFGGNNYGGTLGAGSTQNILVAATKVDNSTSVNIGGTKIEEDVANSIAAKGTAWTATSDVAGHGIRYLFGGGNAVVAPNVNILVKGGQIDTLFAGGNAADVGSTTVTVNVTSPLYTAAAYPYYDATTVTPYNPTTSVYDIRCLFGGNNMADMTNGVPTLTLTKGGIHNVYGGGNRGDMTYGQDYDSDGDGADDRQRSTAVLVNSADIIIDSIYGGGQSAGTSYDTYVAVSNGKVGNIYGGTNIQGTIPATAQTFVEVSGGHVYENVFGGSNGCYLCLNYGNYLTGLSNRTVPDDRYDYLAGEETPKIWNSDVRIKGTAQVDGTVYGGGNLAVMGHLTAAYTNPSTEQAGNANVTISGGTIGRVDGADTIWGGVYGGGNYASIFGYTNLLVEGGIIYGDVYGGNDKTGSVTGMRAGTTAPTLATTTERPAATYPDDMPLYSDLNSGITYLTRSQTVGASYVRVTGAPKIYGSVFGGGNGNYNYYHYDSDGVTEVDANPTADWKATGPRVLKCDNPPYPNQSSALVDLNLSDGAWIGKVFAGGNFATVGENVYLGNGSQVSAAGNAAVWFNSSAAAPTASQVGSLFGGNNMVAMNQVPELYLLQGRANYIYGGGNLGNMTGSENYGSLPFDVSCYIGLASTTFMVDNNVYGGCNAASVSKDTYVLVKIGSVQGSIFGGCDAAGQILSQTHLYVDGDATNPPTIGGHLFGGGNGDYPFYRYDHPNNTAHATDEHDNPYYIANGRNNPILYPDLVGRPYCNETDVKITGTLTLDGNVYGGGISGDCRTTNVLIDAENGVFNGMIFGAGEGRVDNMGLRIGSNCKDYYIGVAHLDGSGNLSYVDNATAMGNVLDTAYLTINNFKSMGGTRKAIFGGGQSGNVGNIEVVYNNTAKAEIDALYLGCLASDVTGRTHGVINAYQPADETPIIDTLYGGNDFTGRVNETYMEINSGNYVHVFGAGNGDYDYKSLLAAWTAPGGRLDDDAGLFTDATICADTVPYSMKVRVDINDGVFLNTVYGGGNMGLVGDRDMVAANMVASNDDRTDYMGEIVLNIHDGDFHRHIFTGARGKADMKGRYFGYTSTNVDGDELGKQLAYAYKQLNMDGGKVHFSVYGGSEAVDDGYPYECIGKAYSASTWYDNDPATSATTGHQSYDVNTTKRPSSVLNIVGGEVRKSVYGGGYQGNIYGSVYVNIGVDAVNDSPVWTNDYEGASFAGYKPNLIGASGSTTTIAENTTLRAGTGANNLVLEASVYNASDWGEASDHAYFNTRGVFGGETNILIDGKGYNTSLTNPTMMALPNLDIANSIIGAGTSTEGGDINRLITVRHYGDFVCPNPSKTIASIQRADKVILDSVFVTMQGEQDAFMAYVSPNYSFCRVDTLLFRIDNIVMTEAPSIYVGHLASVKDFTVDNFAAEHLFQNVGSNDDGSPYLANENKVAKNLLDNLDWNNSNIAADCAANPDLCSTLDFCDKMSGHRGEAGYPGAFNTLVMRNGSYMKVSPFIDLNGDGIDDAHAYGVVDGWMYLMAQDETMSYVYARNKDNTNNTTDGGFASKCYCENHADAAYENEIVYTNVTDAELTYHYRSWKKGTKQGTRVRNIALVANANPDGVLNWSLDPGTYGVRLSGESSNSGTYTVSGDNYGYATATLELPPADGGNFYVINSVLIDQDNGGQLKLTDQAYDRTNNVIYQKSGAGLIGDMNSIAGADGYDLNYTFGLTFSSGATGSNFSSTEWTGTNTCPELATPLQSISMNGTTRSLMDGSDYYPSWPISGISGSTYLEDAGGYISPAVIQGEGIIPSLNFTLTYDKNISTTITREVLFTLYEFDKCGNYVGPVEVTVTISTVIKQFSDLEADVLAMYNEGINNQYTRKVTIPASFLQRDIYLKGVSWTPSDDVLANSTLKGNWFYMQDTVTPVEHNNQFSIVVNPSESTTENVSNHLGWYNIERTNIDVFETALNDYRTTIGDNSYNFTSGQGGQKQIYDSYDYDGTSGTEDTTNLYKNGILLGTLDGRASAGIDVTLNFDGMRVYHDQYSPWLGTVTLHMGYRNTKVEGSGDFDLVIKVHTREQGDTIYVAPGPTLTRTTTPGTGTGTEFTVRSYKTVYGDAATPMMYKAEILNNPDCFVNTLREAMSIYTEGDVIDIMESVTLSDGSVPVTVSGDDFSIIQIIRYSGSHYKFPTEGCANKNPMIIVSGTGVLTMRNVWLNGSGCTMVKLPTDTVPGSTDYNSANSGTGMGGYKTETGSRYYYEHHRRRKAVQYTNAPMLYITDKGAVNFSSNVIMSNNFNDAKCDALTGAWSDATWNSTANRWDGGKWPGGAVALVASSMTGSKPSLVLGNKCNIYSNLVVDWNAATTTDPPVLPLNWGGGVYVDGGSLTLGTGASAASSDGALIDIARNYYLRSTISEHLGIVEKTKIQLDETEFTFSVFEIDTLNHADAFALSNVYLMRTAGTCPGPVRRDVKSDLVYFISDISSKSRVGISKWFPGYRYDGDNTHVYTQSDDASAAGYHRLYNTVPRDTVMVARLGVGKSNAAMADRVYQSGAFFNDSAYYSKSDATVPSFYQHATLPGTVTYCGNTTDNPGYNDRVYIFHHSYVHQFGIYFQRCASFGKGVTQTLDNSSCLASGERFNTYLQGDSIAYRWNKESSCVASTDTILFRVGGGFFPYTYHWDYDSIYHEKADATDHTKVKRVGIRDRVTLGTNNISGLDNAHFTQLRNAAQCDTLVLTDLRQQQNMLRSTYLYVASAYDLTGNCRVEQPVIVRVGKITSEGRTDHAGSFYIDSANYLRHRNPWAAYEDSAAKYYTVHPVSTGSFINSGDHTLGTTAYDEDGDATTPYSVQLYRKFYPTSGEPSSDYTYTYKDSEGHDQTGKGYLYYRVHAPGVDSSSFHDRVTTDADGNLVDAEGYVLTASIDPTEDTLIFKRPDGTLSYPDYHVPIHSHKSELGAHAGLRRAGYSRNPYHHFGLGHNMGTLEQRVYAEHFKGRPYRDMQAAAENGTEYIEYVDADGVKNDSLTDAYSLIYADAMVPRYLRVFRSYKLEPDIYPVAAKGEVKAYEGTDATVELDLDNAEFCPGGVVHLRPTPASTSWEYMAWDFDATSAEYANYVVNDTLNTPTVYYAPGDYWHETVTSFQNTAAASSDESVATLADYDLDYYGDVTIKTAKGLAWLISTVNGYNGQNAHTFHFNTITFDFDGDEVDMSAHKWTPLGNLNNHFEGTVAGSDANQTVKGLIVNEKTLPRVGMFGYMDGADLSSFKVEGSLMKGNSYVGGLAAESKGSHISDFASKNDRLFGAYVIGGVVAKSDTTNVLNNIVVEDMTMVGSAIDAGGFIARSISDTVKNSTADVDVTQLSAITFGGAVSSNEPGNDNNPTGGKSKSITRTVLLNNYVRVESANNSQRVGGLIGNAEAVEMQNNYAHGVARARDYVGGIAGVVGNNVSITNCYYASSMADGKTGYVEYGTPVQKSSSFYGKGKQVILTQKVDGYSNLLRALNAWVNQHGSEEFHHWRSDETGTNDGHPVFGDQEMIQVFDTTRAETCDSYEFEGMDFTESGNYVFHVVDSADYLDSTMTLMLTLHYSDSTLYSDTIEWGEGYDGQGYHFTSEQIRAGILAQGQQEVYTFRYVDSLQTAYGCDSTVVLTLYVLGKGEGTGEVPQQLVEVKVYPNPTRGNVTVEGSDLERVEVYDNVSRRVLVRDVEGDRMQFDLSNQAAGAYYVRVKTQHGTVVKKVIKK